LLDSKEILRIHLQ